MTREEALKSLRDMDHCFLTREYGQEICHALGVKPPDAEVRHDNRSNSKGLTLEGAQEGDAAAGFSAHLLAEYLARKFDSGYRVMCHGIGSRLEMAVNAIEARKGEGGA